MIRGDRPKNVGINAPIFVTQHIAKDMNLLPRHFGPAFFHMRRDVPCCFRDDKQRVFDSAFCDPAGRKLIRVLARSDAANSCDFLTDIHQPDRRSYGPPSKDTDGFAFDLGPQQRMQSIARTVVDIVTHRATKGVERIQITQKSE